MATSVANPKANPNPGTLNAVANDDGSVTIYQANGCYITYFGGNPLWRSNNPGGLFTATPGDGSIGTDPNGRPIFPDYNTGRDAVRRQLQDDARGHDLVQTLLKFGVDNGYSEPARNTLVNQVSNAGVDTSSFWNGNNVSDADRNKIINIIIQNAGYDNVPGHGYVGTQTEQICPPGRGSDGNYYPPQSNPAGSYLPE